MWYRDLAVEDGQRIWKCVIVVPTSIVYSHTCNAIALIASNNERQLTRANLHIWPSALYTCIPMPCA